jgi:hypothetical protein
MSRFYSKKNNGFYDDVMRVDYEAAGTWPADALEVSDSEEQQIRAPKAATKESMIAANTKAIQEELDRLAKTFGYDDSKSACIYAALPAGARFQAEGAAFLARQSSAWDLAFKVLDEVEAGTRTLPTPEEAAAMVPGLPKYKK